jgi:ATP-dependent exoDNAse (exonuclease V) beta subunit
MWNGIMDVAYRSGDKWHIIDYKTNAEGDDLDVRYQKQLVAYVKAFREITGEDADARTYHIDV